MDKIKIRFSIDCDEETIEIDINENWTWGDIDRMLEDWIWDKHDTHYEILELNGEPYEEGG